MDGKGWVKDQTLALNDHLKGHQFKFERDEMGGSRMFYKEWSTDTFWLPETGLSLSPAGIVGQCENFSVPLYVWPLEIEVGIKRT